ncbi:MAG TPA: methyltransferase domain-containing protein [Acidimicrobiia bacterium]|jgi:SAM-dependent methyltransferase|nr:methyltransferase domain-containing protein [Acidimicrobiia bacterium]
MYLNEARLGFDVASRVLRPGVRALEIGSGLGFVSLALRDAGYDVVALEPVGEGFDFFAAAQPVIRAAAGMTMEVLEIGVEELDPQRHGRFDAGFSVHVLEHVPDLDASFRGMAAVLAPEGRMAHVCPNYHVPYEPHVGIPLIPFAPSATRRLFPRRVEQHEGVWNSLNFITSSQVRKLARTYGLRATFERGTMYDFVARLSNDPVFADRHDSAAMKTIERLDRSNALAFMKRIPPSLATPMLFHLAHTGT